MYHMSNIGRTTGYSVAEAYIKTRHPKKVTRREIEKYIKHDKFSQKVFRDHPECRDQFWEGVSEALNVQYGNYSTRIFTNSFQVAEELGRLKRSQQIRAQIELYAEGKQNDDNR